MPDIPAPAALPPVPPDCPAELLAKVGADILVQCVRRWPTRHHELGPCLVWTGKQWPSRPYGRIGDDYVHRIVWRRVYGPIPLGPNGKPLEVDHLCGVTLCQRPDHLSLKTKRQNVQARGPTRGPNKRG